MRPTSTEAHPERPTLRCLRDDLFLPVPSPQTTLDRIDHPLLQKVSEQFAASDTPHERIRAIDDVILFKVKSGRWGAVLNDVPTPRCGLISAKCSSAWEHSRPVA